MNADIISKKTRNEFREYFVGTTLRHIEMEFDAANVDCDFDFVPKESGQRRSLVEQYYHTVDWTSWSDVRKVLTVYENVLIHLEETSQESSTFDSDNWAEKEFKKLNKWIEKDGFKYSNEKITAIGRNKQIEEVFEATSTFDLPELHRQIERIRNSIDTDPGLSIGTSKELIETVCKTILTERGVSFSEDQDVSKLLKEVRKSLGLVPENIPNSAKGADSIRRLLSNLGSVSQGLAELRNLYGSGHGKVGNAKGLSSRHARLAVGAASTLVTFLFETHQERNI